MAHEFIGTIKDLTYYGDLNDVGIALAYSLVKNNKLSGMLTLANKYKKDKKNKLSLKYFNMLNKRYYLAAYEFDIIKKYDDMETIFMHMK